MKIKQLAAGFLAAAVFLTGIPAVPVMADSSEVLVNDSEGFLNAIANPGVTKITLSKDVDVVGSDPIGDSVDVQYDGGNKYIKRATGLTIDLGEHTLDLKEYNLHLNSPKAKSEEDQTATNAGGAYVISNGTVKSSHAWGTIVINAVPHTSH